MEILEFITSREPIAGLEINPGFLRIAELKKEKVLVKESNTLKDKQKFQVKKYQYVTKVAGVAEEILDEGVFSGGELIDEGKFISALNKLSKKARIISKYVIVSIPANKVYTHYFTFPSTIGADKISETMKLNTEFQLPLPSSELYTDWNFVNGENSTILASIEKKFIDKIIAALIKTGYNPVAIEYTSLSLSRILNNLAPVAAVISSKDSYEISIIQNNTPKFLRTLKKDIVKSEIEEFRKVIDFYESEYKIKIGDFFVFGEKISSKKGDLLSKIGDHKQVTMNLGQETEAEDGKWLVSLGAAMRGVLKRSEDRLLSLMPIKTEEAYETKKALAFANFIASLAISISLLMIAIYAGLWFMTMSLQRSVGNQIKALSAIPVPVGGVELESRAAYLNDLISKEYSIVNNFFIWSKVLEGLKNLVPAGINIQSVTLPGIRDSFSISGTASDRNQLKIFKKSLEESGVFTNVELPINNISLRQNIPFSITLRLLNPEAFQMK